MTATQEPGSTRSSGAAAEELPGTGVRRPVPGPASLPTGPAHVPTQRGTSGSGSADDEAVEPLVTAFEDLLVRWDHRVLEPRPWTAAQAAWLAELAPSAPAGPALELCCGAGQIGLAFARRTGRALVQVDACEVAGTYARGNAYAAGVRTQVRLGRFEEALRPGERFPLALADPPWVPRAGVAALPEDPVTAIDGGDDGLDVARACLRTLAQHLLPGGHAVLQLGTEEQAEALARWRAAEGLALREDGVRRCGDEVSGGTLVHLVRLPGR